MDKPIRVSMSTTSNDPQVVARAMEAMSRAATGLALEGVDVWLSARPDEDE
jgi:hypothetical protein